MENQDSVQQAKKKFFDGPGRKRKVIITVIVVLLLIGMIGRGAAFGTARGGYGGFYPAGSGNVALVVKDFEPRGIVFVEAAATAWDGYRATYDALMKEAAQKGADAIINVNISSKWSFLKRTWSGSALAVKYLDTLLTIKRQLFYFSIRMLLVAICGLFVSFITIQIGRQRNNPHPQRI